MPIRIVRLGSDRSPDEGTRIGTVRRPPRGVPKDQFAAGNWYDVWFPTLAPSPTTMKLGRDADSAQAWASFTRHFKAEMSQPEGKVSLCLFQTTETPAHLHLAFVAERREQVARLKALFAGR